MNESDGMTIPIRIEKPDQPPQMPAQEPRFRIPGGKIARSIAAVCVTSITIAGGWFAIQHLNSTRAVKESDSIDDLDGFDSTAPLFAAPTQTRGNGAVQSRRDEIADSDSDGISLGSPADSIAVPPLEFGVPLPSDLPEEVANADVWLTGTIEDADTKEKIPLPTKLSGGPNEGSVVR